MTADWSAETEEHLAEGRGGEARKLEKQVWARARAINIGTPGQLSKLQLSLAVI